MGEAAWREKSGWVAGGVGALEGAGFKRQLHGSWKGVWSSRENAALKSRLGNQWLKGQVMVKIIQRGDLERRDKGSDQNFDKYLC